MRERERERERERVDVNHKLVQCFSVNIQHQMVIVFLLIMLKIYVAKSDFPGFRKTDWEKRDFEWDRDSYIYIPSK